MCNWICRVSCDLSQTRVMVIDELWYTRFCAVQSRLELFLCWIEGQVLDAIDCQRIV
jgi:hypothetical protein